MRLYCHLNARTVFFYGEMNTLINLRKMSQLFAEKNRLHCRYMVSTCNLFGCCVCRIEFSRKQWKMYANLSVVCLHADTLRSLNWILHSIAAPFWLISSKTMPQLISLPYQSHFSTNADRDSHLAISGFTFTFISSDLIGFFLIIFRHRLNLISIITCQK